MSSEGVTQESDHLSPAEMRDWLTQEIRDSTKAFELRVREATEFVTAYALGELTPEEATERCWRYQQRWGEALPGTFASNNVTDEKLLEAIDEARGEYVSLHSAKERYAKLFGKERGLPR